MFFLSKLIRYQTFEKRRTVFGANCFPTSSSFKQAAEAMKLLICQIMS